MTRSTRKRLYPIWVKDMILPDLLLNLVFFIMMQAVGTIFMAGEPNLLEKYKLILWLLIPTLLFLLLRRFALPIIPMLIGHILIAILPVFFLQTLSAQVAFWMEAIVFFLMLYSIQKKYKKTLASSSMLVVIVAIMIHFTLLFVVLLYRQNEMVPYAFSACLFIICFYLAANQLIDFENSFEHFLMSSTQPGRQIKANNHRVISLMVVVMLIFIPISLLLPYDGILAIMEKIGYAITGFLFFLFSLIPTFETEGYGEEIKEDRAQLSELNPQLTQFVNIVQFFLTILVIIILLVGLWKGVVRLILYLRDNYVQKHLTIKFSENENITDEIFHLDSHLAKKSKRKWDFGQGEEKKVRRMYYSVIQRAITKGLVWLPSSTPGELKEEIKNQFGTDITELTESYEEIRYGQMRK